MWKKKVKALVAYIAVGALVGLVFGFVGAAVSDYKDLKRSNKRLQIEVGCLESTIYNQPERPGVYLAHCIYKEFYP